jgi:opacity protein-like surface antigen
LLAAAGAAAGAERGFYLGGSYSSVSADYSTATLAVPLMSGIPDPGLVTLRELDPLGSNAWRVFTGYRALDWLALEGDYGRFMGNRTATPIFCTTIPCPALMRGEVSTTSLSALALYPHGRFDLFLRGGFTHWRAGIETLNYDESTLDRASDSDTDFSYGAGAQYHVDSFAVRLEYQRLRFGADAADLAMLGVSYAF